jgi:integrase/recombinase XerD
MMKVQRVHLSVDQMAWMVLDDDHTPVQPILSYLKYLHNLDRSPNTIRAAAHRLKLFWEYLRDEHLCWRKIDVAQLAAFIPWLRRPDPTVISIAPGTAQRSNATIDLTLGAVYGFYAYHIRLGTLPELPLYQLSLPYGRAYKPFLHGIAKVKPEQKRVVAVKREQHKPKTLTDEQIQALIAACMHTRDKFLLTLMYHTGMRVGQCLGLKHEDLSVEDGEIHIVPRNGNPNGARAKTRTAYTIPGMEDLMGLYTDYLIDDLGALEANALPDFVFVNLFEGNQFVIDQQDRIIPTLTLRIKSLESTEMDGSLCVDDVLTQLRTDLAEAECGLEEAQAAGLVLAARHLERAITEMKMRITALEVPDDRPHE